MLNVICALGFGSVAHFLPCGGIGIVCALCCPMVVCAVVNVFFAVGHHCSVNVYGVHVFEVSVDVADKLLLVDVGSVFRYLVGVNLRRGWHKHKEHGDVV